MFNKIVQSRSVFEQLLKQGQYTAITFSITSVLIDRIFWNEVIYTLEIKATKKFARPLVWRTQSSNPEHLMIYLVDLHPPEKAPDYIGFVHFTHH